MPSVVMGKNWAHDEEEESVLEKTAKLTRKFRVLENDKRAYSEESQQQIRKQRGTIEKLTRENRKMKQECAELRQTDRYGGSNSKAALQELQDLTDKNGMVKDQIKKYAHKCFKADEQFEAIKKKMGQVRQNLADRGGINAASDNQQAIQKQIGVLTNRLDRALQQFNDAVAGNKQCRGQIDSLRRERKVFEEIYQKLCNELNHKTKEMANIIEQANAAYEARDAAQAQIGSLKVMADKEHSEFEKEWRELGRLIENDKKMKEFMKQKQKDVEAKRTADQEGLVSVNDAEELKHKINQQAWKISKGKAAILSATEKTKTYEEAFSKIQAATGISDIDELVETFISAEDQNFSLFNYANLLSADIEKNNGEIEALRKELEVLKGTSADDTDQVKAQLMTTLEDKCFQMEKKSENFELQMQQCVKTLTTVRSGIQSIFNRLGCDRPNTVEGLIYSGVSESNMMQYLGVIEERCDEILRLNYAMEPPNEDALAKPAKPSSTMQIKLPSTVTETEEDAEAEEDDTRPFTRAELRDKVNAKVNASKIPKSKKK